MKPKIYDYIQKITKGSQTKILLTVFALVCCYRITGIYAGNPGFAHSYSLKSQKLKTSFNKGNISMNSPAFTENKGQVWGFDGVPHAEVKFVFQEGNTQIFLLEKGIAYQFTRTHFPEGYTELMLHPDFLKDMEKLQLMQEQIRTETFRMDMMLLGANANPEITSEGKRGDYINYYNRDVLDVHHFTKITYHEIYKGIDWVIYAKDGQVKYDFVVKPGADPSLIKMQFEHQEDLSLNKDGSFTLRNSLGNVTEEKPVSYQGRENIRTDFILKDNIISFALASYNHDQNLVIDPAVIWATYYGAVGGDNARSCSTDASGNVYLAGATSSSMFIASGGHQNILGGYYDAYLVKFNNSGVRQWATYYGGTNAEDQNFCRIDASGNIYLLGYTSAASGIASGGHQNNSGGGSDAYLVKFNGNGFRQWSTYYGGAKQDLGRSCATDASGNIYLAGSTQSSAGIASGGHQNAPGNINNSADAFLVKFDSNGVRQWGTYYGGAYNDDGMSCNTDATGNIYLVGLTDSPSGIASGGYQNTLVSGVDLFLVKFNSSGARQWATYYGADGVYPWGVSCAADASGNIYMSGPTTLTAGIASGGHQNTYGGGLNDAFLVKFNSSGYRLWATYFGGTGDDCSGLCTTDAAGNVYLAGFTDSPSGIASGGVQNTIGGGYDGFLVMFNGNGQRQWATYYGGTTDDSGEACAMDLSGNIYLAGTTESSSGIATGGHQNTFGGNFDAFLAKICVQAVNGNTLGCNDGTQSYSTNKAELQGNIIEVFPNPNAGSFEIRSASPVSITLYNETGQRVWESDGDSSNKRVSVQGLTTGIYLAHLVSETGSSVKKIIVVSD